MENPIILASGSPRRRELLGQIGWKPEVVPSLAEEDTKENEPWKVVESLSARKAKEVAERCVRQGLSAGTIIIGADTVVAAQGRILGKPGDKKEAEEMISLLQGKVHQVYTGVTLMEYRGQKENQADFAIKTFSERTDVWVYPMTEEEIRAYADTGEPMDKAGAYGIQGRFAAYIEKISGDYSNVVGLPVGRVYQETKRLREETEGCERIQKGEKSDD